MQGDDSLVHLENGCICCDLNEEFVKQVVQLSQRGGFDFIVVENTGVADPEPVAESLIEPSIAVGDTKDKLVDIVKLGVPPRGMGVLVLRLMRFALLLRYMFRRL